MSTRVDGTEWELVLSRYKAPKQHLHREFLYLNHETIINSLSALEAGKIDEIIQKANEAREGGYQGGVTTAVASAQGGRKKTAQVEEELVRTRTVFSAFDSWYKYLLGADAIGTFDGWDGDIRTAVQVGDTVEFPARLSVTPVHLLFRTFIAFAERAAHSGSVFAQKADELKATQKTARLMEEMLGSPDSVGHLLVRMEPFGVGEPRVLGLFVDDYFVNTREAIEGEYRVIAQVDRKLEGDEAASALRVLRSVPPTPMELSTIKDALKGFVEPSAALGMEVSDEDFVISAPTTLVRPIAVWR